MTFRFVKIARTVVRSLFVIGTSEQAFEGWGSITGQQDAVPQARYS
jgi:hypothetical protein